MNAPPTANIQAYTLYLQGRSALSKAVWPEEIGAATRYIEQALQLDPKFALAWAQRSRVYSGMWDLGDKAGMLRNRGEALRAARNAIELDERLPEGRLALAKINFYVDWDWASAESEISAARSLDPRNGDVLYWMSMIDALHGRWDEALSIQQRLVELDPLDPGNYWSLGDSLIRVGRYRDAEAAFRKSLDLNPASPTRRLNGWDAPTIVTKVT